MSGRNRRSRSRRSSLFTFVVLSLLVIAAVAVVTALASSALQDKAHVETTATAQPAPETPQQALERLGQLKVQPAGPMTGYSRDKFGPAWKDVDHNGCDTRNDILKRDLAEVTFQADSKCVITKGTLTDPYTGKVIPFIRGQGTSDDVQIDHVVALGDAWQTGASSWSDGKRLELANDPSELLAVDGPTNGSKGDKDAAEWLPPNAAFRCRYAVLQVAVKVKYELWVTQQEHDALSNVLSGCP